MGETRDKSEFSLREEYERMPIEKLGRIVDRALGTEIGTSYLLRDEVAARIARVPMSFPEQRAELLRIVENADRLEVIIRERNRQRRRRING